MDRLPFDKASLPAIPEAPGVYVFLDFAGRALYIGKGRNLRDRVRSYFGAGDGRLVARLVGEKARAIDCIVAGSEKEALLLENSLIKRHRPRLNIRLTDDKTYFSLRLDPKEEWPRLTIVRRRRPEDVLYFGPYTSAQACRRTIQYLNGIFPLRTCPDSVLFNRSRPCLSYEIGRCVAPCVDLVTREAYREIVQRVIRFLSGHDQEVLVEIEAEMQDAARRLEFEKAAELRDRLGHMRATLESPRVARRGGVDRDVIGLHETEDASAVTVVQVRDGGLTGTASFRFRRLGEADELLAAFLGQYYGPGQRPPAEILLPRECADLDLHREILEEKRGTAVDLRVPERGEGLRLLRLAEENAALQLLGGEDGGEEAVRAALQERLRLVHVPVRIECFDISHLGGELVVASRVVFMGGRPHKAGYRHYRLRDVQRNDDFAAMEEVIRRRLRRGLAEGDLPDLIVVDGGRPQLERAVKVLRELRVDAVDVIGLAKAKSGSEVPTIARHERVWVPGLETPVVMPSDAPETHLLERVRDEAHRFAISYNRRLRGREKIGSVLELIPGVGRRRAGELLRRFGSVNAIRATEAAVLGAVPGIGAALAKTILRWFDENARPA